MKKKCTKKVLSLLLALLFVLSGLVLPIAADTSESENITSKTVDSSITDATIDDIREILDADSYDAYVLGNSTAVKTEVNGSKVTVYEWKVPAGKDEIRIDAIGNLYAEGTDAKTKVETYDGVEALYTPASGTVSWKVSIPEDARYNVVLECFPVYKNSEGVQVSKTASVERIFRINSAIPFKEARYLTISKSYVNEYVEAEIKVSTGKKAKSAETLLSEATAVGLAARAEQREDGTYILYTIPDVWTSAMADYCSENNIRFFVKDVDKNEIRPTTEQAPEWLEYAIHDANGYYGDPFEFVFEKSDETIISLTGVNEPLAIKAIRLVPVVESQPYEDLKKTYPAGAAAGTDKVWIQAEYPSFTTSPTIYPVEDTRSAITQPVSSKVTLLNSIGGVGGDKWQTAGQTVAYKFSVNNSGLYNIVARFSQSTLDGMYSSRQITITTGMSEEEYKAKYGNLDGYYNGVPCAEASELRFNYSKKWQTQKLTNGTTDLEFYFREGVEYKIEFIVTLGSMGQLVSKVEDALESINADYLNILKLTGADPDDYRDYGFKRVMPDTVEDLKEKAVLLYQMVDDLQNMAGVKGSMAATLQKIAWLLERMGGDPEAEIARNLTQFKSNIGSLGTWISDAKTQPLQLDYILVQGVGEKLPKAEANFLQSFGQEISSFFQSFVRNYNRMGTTEIYDEDDENVVEVWLAYGRDQTQVIRNLVNNDFTPESGIAVNLKLVAGGTLLPSILAKSGPDVYIGLDQSSVINYAIRGALLPVEQCDGFYDLCLDEEKRQFNESAMLVLGIEDAAKQMHYYGLPETQKFNMMFIRKDILAELELDIPKTWDDVLAAIPVLQANNMQIGMHSDYKIFLYQMGGKLFADEGMRINLDSNTALDAFETMCGLYTNYSFPYSYDFSNRFRTGEMPIGFAEYNETYNKLKVFATEIDGLWGMYPMPGTEQKDGSINNCAVSTITAIVMITGCTNNDAAWSFMKWHSGVDCQTKYSNEMVSILGSSGKHPTANIEALEGLPWSSDELNEIRRQFSNLASIPNYPGNYIVERYTKFAFLAAYNSGKNPSEELLSYINYINKEFTRKRQEFDLETLSYVGQKLSEKRFIQAADIILGNKLTVETGVYVTAKDGTQTIEMQNVSYQLSSDTIRNNAAVFDELQKEISESITQDKDGKRYPNISEELQMTLVLKAIEKLQTLTGLSDSDKKAVDMAIELLGDAKDALLSYQI